MEPLLDYLSAILLASGSFFILVGAIGLIRLPDVFARMHGAGVTDTLGAALFIVGLMVQSGLSLISVKLLLILVFFFFNSCLGFTFILVLLLPTFMCCFYLHS